MKRAKAVAADEATLAVGAPDTTNSDAEAQCSATSGRIGDVSGWVCTRPDTHDDGIHAAGDGEVIRAVWSDDNPTGQVVPTDDDTGAGS